MTEQSDFRKLQDDIVYAVTPDSANSTGWRTCYCPICDDRRRKTAGVLVDGDSVAFHCFKASCDADVVHTFGESVSRKFKDFCKKINVAIPVSLRMKKSRFQKELESLDDQLYKKHVYKDMPIPDGWVPLGDTKSKKWKDYYANRRIPIDNILYISRGINQGLTAVVFKYFDKVIGFQICDPDGQVKYRTVTDNEHILAINHGLMGSPVILVEGTFDALSIPNGVGLLNSKIVPEQAYQLRGKDVIMVPDRSGNTFIDQAKKYGWKVCIPPWSVNDVNAAVQKYGSMVVCRMIMDHTYTNLGKARIAYQQWREKK